MSTIETLVGGDSESLFVFHFGYMHITCMYKCEISLGKFCAWKFVNMCRVNVQLKPNEQTLCSTFANNSFIVARGDEGSSTQLLSTSTTSFL